MKLDDLNLGEIRRGGLRAKAKLLAARCQYITGKYFGNRVIQGQIWIVFTLFRQI